MFGAGWAGRVTSCEVWSQNIEIRGRFRLARKFGLFRLTATTSSLSTLTLQTQAPRVPFVTACRLLYPIPFSFLHRLAAPDLSRVGLFVYWRGGAPTFSRCVAAFLEATCLTVSVSGSTTARKFTTWRFRREHPKSGRAAWSRPGAASSSVWFAPRARLRPPERSLRPHRRARRSGA